jgi:phosphatidylethanolamine-binding protein (PEBP) family uncharacterized protein
MKISLSQRFVCLILMILFLPVVAGCGKQTDTMSVMAVSFQWNPPGTPLDQSPEITISEVPQGTHRFFVELVDLDMKVYDHGGGTYAYNGSPVIPAGGLDGDYVGPHPPPGVVHRYEVTVKALDDSGVVIGEGRSVLKYPKAD